MRLIGDDLFIPQIAQPSIETYQDDDETRRLIQVLLSRAQRARHSISAFTSFVMREETTRAPIRIMPHQEIMYEFAMAHNECVIMLPVGHAKTYGMSTIALYQLGLNNTNRGAFVSATQGQASKPLSMVKDYIETSDELKLVFPQLMRSQRRNPSGGFADPWTQTEITVDRPPGIRDPSVVCVGIDGAIDGARLSWAVVDDILNRENTATKDQRDKVYQWFDASVISRLDPGGGRLTVTNVAWHPDDLLHRLMDMGWPTLRMEITGNIEIRNTEWDHPGLRPEHKSSTICRLAAHDPDPTNSVPLWPEKFSLEYIEKTLKRRHLPSEFNRLYMNICRDNASAKCKVEWIEQCKWNAQKMGYHRMTSRYTGRNLTFTGLDLAISPGEESDDTAFFTFEVFPSGHRLILDIEIGKFDGPTTLDLLFKKREAYNSIIRVENNGAQDYLRQFALQRDISVPLKPHTTGRVKAHPEYGVEGLFIELYNGAWLIPCDTHGQVHSNIQRWINACLYYQPSKHTDDSLMACYFAREQAREWGVLSGGDTASMAGASPVAGALMAR